MEKNDKEIELKKKTYSSKLLVNLFNVFKWWHLQYQVNLINLIE